MYRTLFGESRVMPPINIRLDQTYPPARQGKEYEWYEPPRQGGLAGILEVSSGCLAGSYDSVVISTDLEPDDVLCIAALENKLRGVPLLVVVGEGAADKATMAAELLASFNLDSRATVVQGKRSAVTFPDGVTESYRHERRVPACKVQDGGESAAVRAVLAVDAFLSKHARPLALLLKPPHEFLTASPVLLGKTKGVLYGSFNLQSLHPAMTELAGSALSAAELHVAEIDLMKRFAKMLWIERSTACGRDCVLEPSSCPPAIWQYIDSQAGLTRHIQAWNTHMIASIADKIAKLPTDVRAALDDDADGARTKGDAHYSRLDPYINQVDKRVQILVAITACRGKQVCHADTLVSAAILDESGSLAKYERPSPAGPERLYQLVSEPGDERDALVKASFKVLERAFSSQMS